MSTLATPLPEPPPESQPVGTVVHRENSNLWAMWLHDALDRPSHLGIRRDHGGLMLIPSPFGLFVPDRFVPQLRVTLAEAFNTEPIYGAGPTR